MRIYVCIFGVDQLKITGRKRIPTWQFGSIFDVSSCTYVIIVESYVEPTFFLNVTLSITSYRKFVDLRYLAIAI